MGAFGITFAGEFSNAINDCGLYVNGVGLGARFDGTFPGFTGKGVGNCDDWTKWETWDQPTKDGLKLFALASMDALTVRSSTSLRIIFTDGRIYRTGSSGRGRLEMHWIPAASIHLYGPISSVSNKAGCQRTLDPQQACARRWAWLRHPHPLSPLRQQVVQAPGRSTLLSEHHMPLGQLPHSLVSRTQLSSLCTPPLVHSRPSPPRRTPNRGPPRPSTLEMGGSKPLITARHTSAFRGACTPASTWRWSGLSPFRLVQMDVRSG